MAIHVQIKDAKITQDGLALAIQSTNDAKPGVTVHYEKSYATTLTADQIKAQIDADLTLLWTALAVGGWSF